MTATYQSIGAKVDSLTLHIDDPKYVPLSASDSPYFLLRFRAHANLIIEARGSTEPEVHFRAPADVFIPVVLLQTPVNVDKLCGIIKYRLFDKRYALDLRSLTPLSDISSINAYRLLDDPNLSTMFARYFSPDSTAVPVFIYKPHPFSAFFEDLKDLLRPLA